MAPVGTGVAARWGDRIPGASVRTLWLQRLLGIALALLVAGGLVGLYRYVDNYWLYRGYAPPKDPAWVVERGTTRTIAVSSPAAPAASPPIAIVGNVRS
jgi:hypothetical protein